jgi:hypothetical protein
MRKLLAVLVVMVLMLGLVGTTSAAEPTTVYLVNTLRTVLDVYVDGNLIIEDLAPNSIRGPFVGEISGETRIEMIPANAVLGEEDPNILYYPTLVTRLPVGETVAIVVYADNIPGSLGSLDMFTYDFAPTGPGHSRLMVYNALTDDDIEIVLSPGTANEQHLPFIGNQAHREIRLPAGPKTALVLLWGRNPAPEVMGPFTANLQPGKLYVVFVSGNLGGGLQPLTQEFNVGQ